MNYLDKSQVVYGVFLDFNCFNSKIIYLKARFLRQFSVVEQELIRRSLCSNSTYCTTIMDL
ncbi:hypothetical protein LguiA_006897 [Lonicera macranthoides]